MSVGISRTEVIPILNNRSRESIVSTLVQFASIDNDFNGENGEEYLWPDAKATGYKSNAEYLANLVYDELPKGSNFEDYANAFAKAWNENDGYWSSIEIIVGDIVPGAQAGICIGICED